MTDHPGYLQDRPLIEEMAAEMMSHDIQALPDSPLFAIHWEEYGSGYRFNAEKALDVLRRRGLLNLQGLEIIKREME